MDTSQTLPSSTVPNTSVPKNEAMQEEEEGEIGSGKEGRRVKRAPPIRLPLNSKRLKVGHLRRLAAAMGVPTTASADELRQLIDGTLTEKGRESSNVQVVLENADATAEFTLEDEGGQFLTVTTMEEETGRESPDLSEQEEEGQEVDTLRKEVEALAEENQSLKAEVSSLGQKLLDEKARFRDMWRSNCQCLADCDDVISVKDSEIEELKRQLRSHARVSVPLTGDTREADSHEIVLTHSHDTHAIERYGTRGRGEPSRREPPF